MSLRNGDRSRAHRLRKAKTRRRAHIRELQAADRPASKPTAKPAEPAPEPSKKAAKPSEPASKPSKPAAKSAKKPAKTAKKKKQESA